MKRRRVRAAPKPEEAPEAARRESKRVDFKKSFDIASTGEWCEMIKDIVTMANSGSGAIVVGSRTTPSRPALTAHHCSPSTPRREGRV
jgi:hypothetical protein